MTEKAILEYEGKKFELPIVVGTEGEKALDISKLRSTTKLVTLDPGYMNTGSCESAITFLDGEKGILRYRGYPIDQLAEKSTFLEVTYLLIFGELPTSGELADLKENITRHTLIHEDMKRFYDGFPKDAHPMAILSSAVSALSTFYQDTHNPKDEEAVRISIYRLIAKIPTIAAYAYKKSIGQPFIYPDNSLRYCANFLKMMFSVPTEEYKVNPVHAEALDLLLILHADHEQNCSTSTMRIVGSSMANLFASTASGISALWGPLHGGANQAVIEMLERIKNDGGNIKKYTDMAKDKTSDFRLSGFGHRVYKNFDPRARIIKKSCDRILKEMGTSNPLLDIAKEIEEIVLKDDYFVERKLYPNVDFYSGIIYSAIGIPMNMFTGMFSIGRLPGWIAQWCEMMKDPALKIGRPRQIYTGKTERQYTSIEDRNSF